MSMRRVDGHSRECADVTLASFGLFKQEIESLVKVCIPNRVLCQIFQPVRCDGISTNIQQLLPLLSYLYEGKVKSSCLVYN